MSDLKRHPLLGYLLPVLLVIASLSVTLLLWPGMRETPFVLLFFAVLLSSWRGGYKAGLIATGLAALTSKLFLIPPPYSLSFQSGEDVLRLLIFVFNSLLFVWLFSTRKATEEALRQSEESLRELFENAKEIIYTHDLEGNYTSLNKAGERITGYTQEEARGMNVVQVVAPEYLELVRGMIARKVDEQVQTLYQLEIISKDGRRVPLEISTQLIYEDGRPVGVQGIARDITKRRQAEEALRESEERYRELFENANDLIYTHDLKGNFTSLNRAGQRITGYTHEEALRLNIAQVVAPKYLKTAREMLERKTGADDLPTRYELEIFAKDGRRIPLEVSTRVIIKGGEAVGVQGIARDITEHKRTEETLRSLSLLDDLTGLYNRRGFLALAEQHIRLTQRTGHGFTLVFADLDGMKRINDTYGHKAGDEALRSIAELLKKSFRESDIIARLGGDEFTILALEDYEITRRAVTKRLLENLENYNRQENRPFDLSLSVGVVHFSPESNRSIEELMAQADRAMYEQKQSRKNSQSGPKSMPEFVL
jgi:diguanylate cyclase (GGDEF)-like protein/PAS domain S-box-containing protein